MAGYPGSLFGATGAWRGPSFTADMKKQIADEVASVQSTLGTNPQGDAATVAARLTALETLITTYLSAPLINLRLTNNTTTPNTKVDLTADVLSVQGATLSNVSTTIDIGVTGVNGLDTGSASAGTWYYIYAIYNLATLTFAGLFSLNQTTPTLPSGYTLYRRVGAVRRNASNVFLNFEQRNQLVVYGTSESADYRLLSLGVQTAFTTVTLAAAVPPTTTIATVNAVLNGSLASSAAWSLTLRRGGSSDAGWIASTVYAPAGTAVDGRSAVAVRLSATQQVDYKINIAPQASSGAYLDVLGYLDPI